MPRLFLSCLLASLFASLCVSHALAQDTTLVLDTSMFNANQQLNLASAKGWVYHSGYNPAWASPDLTTKGWIKYSPSDLSAKDADKTGRVDGWFRLKIRLDSTWKGIALGLKNNSWAATDVYIDGRLAASFGSTGANGKPYREHYFIYQLPGSIQLLPGQEHVFAIHLVDYVSPFPYYTGRKLQSEVFGNTTWIVQLTGPRYPSNVLDAAKKDIGYITLWLAIWLFMTICFWLLSWLNFYEKATLQLLAAAGTFATISTICGLGIDVNSSFTVIVGESYISSLSLWLTLVLVTLTLLTIFGYPINRRWSSLLIIVAIVGAALDGYAGSDSILFVANLVQQLVIVYLLISSWKRLQGAQWSIVIGALVSYVAAAMYSVFTLANLPLPFDFYLINSIIFLAFPISFLVYIVLRFREILAQVREKSTAVLRVTEEKRQLLATQNQVLEQQVETRTVELNQSLTELKTTQAQLIQKEKLASLGELTAGIAHEIQNPLNFVNNFSEVSAELVAELEEEQHKPDRDAELEAEILGDLKQNLQKINHHGGRASAIVKGMLEHSRTETGEKRPTDLNALANEYLRIAYQGQRSKNNDLSCELITDFDPILGQVELMPQEIGRVLMNLFNNAFYAVLERSKQHSGSYTPTVTLGTKRLSKSVEIYVRDNGTGMPEEVKAKIFQPFFTTKPTGEGTGLGLSLSYDIVTQGHQGSLQVNSEEGQGTEFIIQLPQL